MDIGMLWFDDDPRKSLTTKIQQAVARYCEKYGRDPTACYVNPASPAMGAQPAGLRILALRTIRPNYLWLGVDDGPQAPPENEVGPPGMRRHSAP
jgi:hypothetical protein